MIKIEMLTDELPQRVEETVTRVHRCVGDPSQCESPAVCESCGATANSNNPVFVWTSKVEYGLEYFVCSCCVKASPLLRAVEV